MVLSNLVVIWTLIFHQRRCSYFEKLPYTTTDVANAVLDGSDAILLGAETLRGLYPIETISTFGRICSEKDKFNPRFYVVAATDNMSLQKAQLLENSLADQFCHSVCYPAIPDGHEIRKTKLKTMIEVSRGKCGFSAPDSFHVVRIHKLRHLFLKLQMPKMRTQV
ncbi:hypothetical protein HN873_059550, partial [Arachis hypogaea]